MVDHSAGDELENAIRECALAQPDVQGVDLIRTREFGSRVYVDIEICADGNLSLSQSHEIAQHVHDAIEGNFEKVKHIMVHVNPLGEDGAGERVKCAMESPSHSHNHNS